MADITQIELHSSLAKGQLLVNRVLATEALGQPFKYELDLLSPDPGLDLDALAGDKMTIEVSTPEGPRYFNGVVAEVSQGAASGRYTRYHATLRPFFWLLTRASDSRIYKKSSVPDIIKEAIGRLGVGLTTATDVAPGSRGPWPPSACPPGRRAPAERRPRAARSASPPIDAASRSSRAMRAVGNASATSASMRSVPTPSSSIGPAHSRHASRHRARLAAVVALQLPRREVMRQADVAVRHGSPRRTPRTP